MESGSFTIEFSEHLPREERDYCLGRLSDLGASLERRDERTFRVVCVKPNQLAHVGWSLFHTHFANLCRVIATSGTAQNLAGAYPKPSK